MEPNKKYYLPLIGLIFLEIINLTFKIFSPYYFNLIVLLGLIFVTTWLGWESKVNRALLVTLAVLTLLLTVTMLLVVWN